MKKMNRRKLMFALAAVALVLTAVIRLEDAAAYFTTYVSAGGSQVIRMGFETELEEDVSNMTKHISIKNTSKTNDCYIRVKVFNSSQFEVQFTDKSESGNLWRYSQEDGYWYYDKIVPPGGSTGILDAKIVLPDGFEKDSFNVIVIQECTPVIYDKDGKPSADWNTVYTDYVEYETTDQQGKGA